MNIARRYRKLVASRRTVAGTYGAGLLFHGSGLLISLLAQAGFARMMGPADFGIFALALAMILFPVNLANLGVEPSTARFLAVNLGQKRFDRIRSIMKRSAFFLFCLSVGLSGCILLFSPQLARWYSIPAMKRPIQIFALFVPAIYLQRWSSSIMRGLGQINLQIILESLLLQVLILCYSVALWWYQGNVEAVMLGHGLAYLSVGLISLWQVVSRVSKMELPKESQLFSFREIVRHGLPLNISAIGQRLLRRGDVFVIGAMLGENAVGLYRSAYVVASGVRQLLAPINSFALFRMSKHVGRKDLKATFSHYQTMVLWSLIITLPLYIFLFAFAEQCLNALYKARYTEATPILRILVFGFAVFAGTGPVGALFNATGKNWARMNIVLGVSAANILLNILFIRIMGLAGAAVGTGLSFLALYLLFHSYTKEGFGQIVTGKLPLLTILVMGIICVGIYYAGIESTAAKVIVSILGSVVVASIGIGGIMASSQAREKGPQVNGKKESFSRERGID